MRCYLCHHTHAYRFTKHGYDIYQCPSCGLFQTHLPIPYQSFVASFYDKGYFTGDESRGAYTDYAHDKAYIMKNMEIIIRSFPQTCSKSVLDVGSAYGYFVSLALDYGYDAYGFDPCGYARSQALPTLQKRLQKGTIDTVRYPKKSFGIITLLDVIEHLSDPIKDCKILRKYLCDDGYLVIATGDTDSWLAKILQKRWTFFIPPQHLFFFNKQTLARVLERSGFCIVRTFRMGKWVSLGYVLHLAKVSSHSHFAAFLIPIVQKLHLQHVPLYLPLMDNMVVIAQPCKEKKEKKDAVDTHADA